MAGQNTEQLSSSSGKKKQTTIIVTVTVIVLVVAALLYILPQQKTVAGKAVHQKEEGTFAAGQQSIRFESATLDGAVNDQFTLPVFIKTNEKVTQIDFELTFPTDKIELVPTGCIAGTNCKITTHTSLGSIGYPSGKDLTWTLFGVGAGEAGGDVKVLTFTFRILGGAVNEKVSILLEKVRFRSGTTPLASELSTTATLTIADPCTDADQDGFGDPAGDLRACAQLQGDCNDAAAAINPTATEICDGVDNDCDSLIDGNDNTLSGAGQHNGVELGVCTGEKICTGAGGFQNSYEVTDPTIFGATAITFTSPKGTFTQQDLYKSDGELCDFFDNDCDGSVNEEINCDLGKASLVGSPPGNVFVDYGTDNTHKDPQELKSNDRLVFNKMLNLYNLITSGTPTCGTSGLPPCGPEQFTAQSNIYYCANGVYFIESTASLGTVSKFSPTENKQTGIAVADIGNCE